MFSHRGFLLLACWSLIGAQFQPSLAAQKSGGVAGVTEHVVFDGLKGWEKDGLTYRLACGALLIQAPNGDLLCTWLSGTDNEPSTDNCVLIARSADKGTTWTEPDILIPAGEMAGAVTSLHTTTDGRIILFGAHWPSREQYTVWHFFRQESRDSGHTWSPPVPVVLHENHAFISCPIQLSNGEFLFPASFFEKRPQPFPGPARKLAQAATEEEALAIPPSPGEQDGGKFSTHLHGCSVFIAGNENAAPLTEYGKIGNRPLGLLEPTCIQLKDGRIVMLMRAEFGGYLWRADSLDNGRTWSTAWQTDIPNPSSLAHLIRLNDGGIALLNNATGGVVGTGSHRDPLSIWISRDEMQTWSLKADILHGGSLAYPHSILLGDRLVFVYDHNRRQVRFVEVSIPN